MVNAKKVLNDILGSQLVRDLRLAIEQNPLGALAVAGVALGSVAKLIDAISAAQGRRAYAKMANERVRRGQAQRARKRRGYDEEYEDYSGGRRRPNK